MSATNELINTEVFTSLVAPLSINTWVASGFLMNRLFGTTNLQYTAALGSFINFNTPQPCIQFSSGLLHTRLVYTASNCVHGPLRKTHGHATAHFSHAVSTLLHQVKNAMLMLLIFCLLLWYANVEHRRGATGIHWYIPWLISTHACYAVACFPISIAFSHYIPFMDSFFMPRAANTADSSFLPIALSSLFMLFCFNRAAFPILHSRVELDVYGAATTAVSISSLFAIPFSYAAPLKDVAATTAALVYLLVSRCPRARIPYLSDAAATTAAILYSTFRYFPCVSFSVKDVAASTAAWLTTESGCAGINQELRIYGYCHTTASALLQPTGQIFYAASSNRKLNQGSIAPSQSATSQQPKNPPPKPRPLQPIPTPIRTTIRFLRHLPLFLLCKDKLCGDPSAISPPVALPDRLIPHTPPPPRPLQPTPTPIRKSVKVLACFNLLFVQVKGFCICLGKILPPKPRPLQPTPTPIQNTTSSPQLAQYGVAFTHKSTKELSSSVKPSRPLPTTASKLQGYVFKAASPPRCLIHMSQLLSASRSALMSSELLTGYQVPRDMAHLCGPKVTGLVTIAL